jgi:NADH-quinone oxidoreductase subunit N
MSQGYFQLLKLAAPETILVVTALVVLTADLFTLRDVDLRFRRIIGSMIASLGCIAATVWMLAFPAHANVGNGFLSVDALTQTIKIALLAFTVFTLVISVDASFTIHVGEYFALILLGTLGMMFLVNAEDILMIFIALELTSLSLYILTAFNRSSVRSAEAALKYFLFGGLSAAFALFGFSLLYGLSGSTNLRQIGAVLQGPRLDPMLVLALVATVLGFGFKIAAVPFHLWAPDVYQGAPASSAAFIASGSKVASFFIFAKVLLLGFSGVAGNLRWRAYQPGWVQVLAIVAALSMVLGNLAAIVQTSVRRLLAYSAVAHAGYMLLAIMGGSGTNLTSLVYYSVTYGLTTLGAFGVVAVVEDASGSDRIGDFAGLSRRAPGLSCCMLVFMLSLAGIPPLAGFLGKFFVFASALERGAAMDLLWLVALAIAFSAVSLYYYLQVLKQIYVAEPAGSVRALPVPAVRQVALVLLALAVLGLGCAPNWFLAQVAGAVKAAGF